MKKLSYMLSCAALLSSAAAAQVMPLAADSVAASACLNVHNEIFPNHNSGTPPNYPYNYPAGFGANNQFFDVTLPAVKAAGVRCLRVGSAAPSGDGGTHQSEFQLRMQTENMLGFALDIVTGNTQAGIDKNFALDGDTGGASETWDGLNEPDLYEGCKAIIASQKLLYNAVKTDSNPQISSMPVLGPSLTRTVPSTWLKTCPIFAGIADIGNWHTYIHANNPEAGMPMGTKQAGWDWAYFAHAQALYPNLPIYATEYGYASIQPGGVADSLHLPDNIITRYVPRWVLTKLMIGYTKGYWHQVADGYTSPQGSNAGYGLFFDYYGNPKTQGMAFGNLIHLFEDPSPVTPVPLSYTITRQSGNSTAPFAMLFQKSDGHYLLPIWLGLPGWNGSTKLYITVLPEVVSVQLGTSVLSVTISTFADDGSVSQSMVAPVNGLFQMTVTDHLQVLAF